jgi:hypothetical protein
MADYVATERITRARPRFVGTGLGWAAREPEAADAGWLPERSPIDPRPLDRRLQDAWSEFREEWSQATFFLFDPNSWR